MKLRGVVVVAALIGACARASLNRTEVSGAHEESVKVSDVPVLGAPVEVQWSCGKLNGSTQICAIEGELIAVDQLFVYVDSKEPSGTAQRHAIERARIAEVIVEVSKSQADALGGWTALGCASSLSHGYFVAITGPVWLATGISASVGESRRAHAIAHSKDLGDLYQFARFPQGLPTWSNPATAPSPSTGG